MLYSTFGRLRRSSQYKTVSFRYHCFWTWPSETNGSWHYYRVTGLSQAQRLCCGKLIAIFVSSTTKLTGFNSQRGILICIPRLCSTKWKILETKKAKISLGLISFDTETQFFPKVVVSFVIWTALSAVFIMQKSSQLVQLRFLVLYSTLDGLKGAKVRLEIGKFLGRKHRIE